MTNNEWDKKLKIQTTGTDNSKEDAYHYPYEPTSYSVLERLVESDYIRKEDIVIDYGCGKGRVSFFLSYNVGCKTIGVDFDENMYNYSMENKKTFIGMIKPDFECASAEKYKVNEATAFYFFNPFSVEIFRAVLGQIMDSYYDNPREMKLFFYYPNDEYVSYLMTQPQLQFFDEIDCRDLFEGNNEREKILIFEVEG